MNTSITQIIEETLPETSTRTPEISNMPPKDKAETTSKKSSGHIIEERLPNGWIKKAVKRLSGIKKGKWEVFLITPDRRFLRTPEDLKVYSARYGLFCTFVDR